VSQENVDLARGAFDLWLRGDFAACQALCAPDVVIVQPPEVPDAKSYEGPNAMIAALEDWPKEWEDFKADLIEVIDVSDDIVITGTRHVGRGRSSGLEMDFLVYYVARLRDGKLARWEMYLRRDQALDAVGLSE
jgi:ketosteroid isomerase-like protein